jgi:predicted ATPase
LPPDVTFFTGRDAELAKLDALLDHGTPAAVVISAIAGTAEIGKTSLAVRWAH